MRRAKKMWKQGQIYLAIAGIATLTAGVAGGIAKEAPAGSPLKTRAGTTAGAAGALAAAAASAFTRKRIGYRILPENPVNVARVGQMRDHKWLQDVDYRFIENYAIDPKGVESEMGGGVSKVAADFATVRLLRKVQSPSDWNASKRGYRIRTHESSEFSNAARLFLQAKVGQLPEKISNGRRKDILSTQFPQEDLRPIQVSELPEGMRTGVFRRILNVTPNEPQEAFEQALLAAALYRRFEAIAVKKAEKAAKKR